MTNGPADSTDSMTPERLQELERLCEQATPGPWRQDSMIRVVAGPDSDPTDIIDYEREFNGDALDAGALSDLAFIAASREAIPELLAEVGRLQRIADAARTFVYRDPWLKSESDQRAFQILCDIVKDGTQTIDDDPTRERQCTTYVDRFGHRHTIHAHPGDGRACTPAIVPAPTPPTSVATGTDDTCPTVLTRRSLEAASLQKTRQLLDDGGLVSITSKCHRQAGVNLWFLGSDGRVLILCAECSAGVAWLQVANGEPE